MRIRLPIELVPIYFYGYRERRQLTALLARWHTANQSNANCH